jgi:hypothetical protein
MAVRAARRDASATKKTSRIDLEAARKDQETGGAQRLLYGQHEGGVRQDREGNRYEDLFNLRLPKRADEWGTNCSKAECGSPRSDAVE